MRFMVGAALLAGLVSLARAGEPTDPFGSDSVVAPRPSADLSSGRFTMERDATTVEDLLATLAKPAGRTLTAAPEIRWTQVSLRVRGRSAIHVSSDLARLLSFAWESKDERSTLRQSLASRVYEDGLRRAWFGRAAEQLLQYAALANYSPAHYVRLRQSLDETVPRDQRLHPKGFAMEVLTDPARHAALRLLLTLSREQLLALVSAGPCGYYLPWREMTARQRALALEVAAGMPQVREWVREFGLQLEVHLRKETNHPATYLVRVANAFLACGDDITPVEQFLAGSGSASPQGYPYASGGAKATVPTARDSEYRDLEKMPFPSGGFRQAYPSTWPEIFAQLGERLPYALYSDYFPSQPFGQHATYFANDVDGARNPPFVALDGMNVAEGLDALCVRHGKVWWREGDALLFRSRLWFLDRLYMIPPPMLGALRQHLESRGTLDRRRVDLLARLSQHQLARLDMLVAEELKEWVPGPSVTMYWPMRAYALLPEGQREQVIGPGVPFARLGPQQQMAYREAVLLCGSRSTLELVETPPTFRLEQSVTPGEPGRRPSLCELSYFLPGESERREKPRRRWRRLANLQLPFPAREKVERTQQ